LERQRFAGLGLVLGAVTLMGCVHQLPMEPACASVKEASGRVVVERKPTGVRVVRIRLHDLPPPAAAAAGRRAYVVWAITRVQAENLGPLRFKDGDEAVLEAVAPTDEFSLFVTEESDPDAAVPSADRLFVSGIAATVH
jgi:hypothetical protein